MRSVGPTIILTLAVTAGSARPMIQSFGAVQDSVGYADVQRVLTERCTSCHAGAQAAHGLALDSWEHLVAGSDVDPAVIPYDGRHSLLLGLTTRLVGGPHPRELDAAGFTDAEVSLVRQWIVEGARGPDRTVPYGEADLLLYVANQGVAMASVIDMETNRLIRTIDLQALGFPPNSMPHHIAVEPDGSFWYLSLIASNAVLKFNRHNELVGQAEVERPGLVALDPSSDRLFVARSMVSANPPTSLGVITRSTMTVEELGTFIPRPHALAVASNGRSVITASLAGNQFVVIDPIDEVLELTDLGGERPHTFIGLAVSPDGRWMIGTTELTSKVFVFDLDRLPDLTPIDTIDVNPAPWHPVFSPDGRWAYVGNNWGNSVTVINMANREVEAVIEGIGIAQPHGSAVSPDGRYVYISNRNLEMPQGHSKAGHRYAPRYDLGDNATTGTVVVIDATTHQIIKVIEIPDYGSGMGTAARVP